MEFSISVSAPEKTATGCLVLGVFREDAGEEEDLASAPRLAPAAKLAAGSASVTLRGILERGDLTGKPGSTLLLHQPQGFAAERVLLVGLGSRKKYGVGACRDALRGAAGVLKNIGAEQAHLFPAQFAVAGRGLPWSVRSAVLALREAFYRFDRLKTRKKAPPPRLKSVVLGIAGGSLTPKARGALKEGVATADGVEFARTLGDLPANLCTPSYLADEARKLAGAYALGIEVLERRDMEKLGMGALLSVTRGSRAAPKLIVLRYAGAAKREKPLALIGKGITFDSGGISLKPAGEMDEMKFDMSGAGSVLGTLRALAALRAPANVIGIIPACENMPGGLASRPGDVVTTLSGQTVEILNTDAEGRLILCDALAYAERFEPEAVVDVATLTGACVVALGHVATGLFANDQKLADDIRAAGEDAWDRVWQMPLWEDYQDQLRSNFADLANIGGRPAGAVTAAGFLSRFARKLRWAHLDIAGTAWKSGREKGSTGRPVPLLVRFVLRRAGFRA